MHYLNQTLQRRELSHAPIPPPDGLQEETGTTLSWQMVEIAPGLLIFPDVKFFPFAGAQPTKTIRSILQEVDKMMFGHLPEQTLTIRPTGHKDAPVI